MILLEFYENGNDKEILEHKEWVCPEGSVFIVPPYVVHSVRQERNACLILWRCRMGTFELFENGKLFLPEKETDFSEMAWSRHQPLSGSN